MDLPDKKGGLDGRSITLMYHTYNNKLVAE